MRVSREARHVHADLGDNYFGDAQTDAGDGLQQLERLRHERVGALGDLLDDLLADARRRRLQLAETSKQFVEDEALGGSQAARQCAAQFGRLRSERTACQGDQLLGIIFAVCQSAQHQTTGDAKDIGSNLPQLNVGTLDQLLNAIGHGGVLFDKRLPVAR